MNIHDKPARVVLADDECLFRASLRQLLGVPPAVIKDVYGIDVGCGFEVAAEAASGEDTVRVVRAVRPDLLLLDLQMPRMSGLDALRELADVNVRTILLAGTIGRPHLLTAVDLGVHALVLKDSTTELLFEAMTSVLAGQYWLGQTLVTDLLESVRPLIQSSKPAALGLTRREREVLTFVVAGYPNKDIARACAVSEETVKHHLTRIFDKVGVSNRLELAMIANERGLLAPPEAEVAADASLNTRARGRPARSAPHPGRSGARSP